MPLWLFDSVLYTFLPLKGGLNLLVLKAEVQACALSSLKKVTHLPRLESFAYPRSASGDRGRVFLTYPGLGVEDCSGGLLLGAFRLGSQGLGFDVVGL